MPSSFRGDFLAVEFERGAVALVGYRDFKSFRHGLYTYRLPPDGAGLIRRWTAGPPDATLAGVLFDYLTEHRDVIRPTANCEYFGASAYDKLLAHLKAIFAAAHPDPPARRRPRKRRVRAGA